MSSKPSRETVRAQRARLRAQGLRPIQLWVPDVHSPAVRAEARRQSLAVALSAQDETDQAFIDAVSDVCQARLRNGRVCGRRRVHTRRPRSAREEDASENKSQEPFQPSKTMERLQT